MGPAHPLFSSPDASLQNCWTRKPHSKTLKCWAKKSGSHDPVTMTLAAPFGVFWELHSVEHGDLCTRSKCSSWELCYPEIRRCDSPFIMRPAQLSHGAYWDTAGWFIELTTYFNNTHLFHPTDRNSCFQVLCYISWQYYLNLNKLL